jgi:hypothetical protein
MAADAQRQPGTRRRAGTVDRVRRERRRRRGLRAAGVEVAQGRWELGPRAGSRSRGGGQARRAGGQGRARTQGRRSRRAGGGAEGEGREGEADDAGGKGGGGARSLQWLWYHNRSWEGKP